VYIRTHREEAKDEVIFGFFIKFFIKGNEVISIKLWGEERSSQPFVYNEVEIIILCKAQFELDLSQHKPIIKLLQLELEIVSRSPN